MNDAPVDSLPGIGPVTVGWLKDVDVRSVDDLRSIGSVEAYRRLKFMLPRRVNLNALYALEAALRGCHWLDLPEDVKSGVQQQAKMIDEAFRRGAAARCAIG